MLIADQLECKATISAYYEAKPGDYYLEWFYVKGNLNLEFNAYCNGKKQIYDTFSWDIYEESDSYDIENKTTFSGKNYSNLHFIHADVHTYNDDIFELTKESNNLMFSVSDAYAPTDYPDSVHSEYLSLRLNYRPRDLAPSTPTEYEDQSVSVTETVTFKYTGFFMILLTPQTSERN